MKQLRIASYLGFLALVVLAMNACKKVDMITPQEQAHFGLKNSATYFITSPTTTYAVPIGFTNVSDQARTVTVDVTSPTGAVLGTHYSLSTTTVTIPAGQALDSIIVQGVYSEFLTGRKDTLIFTITDPNQPNAINNTFTLLMRGPCFPGDITLTTLEDLLGVYNSSFDAGIFNYGPYTTTVTSITPLTATTARVVINNVFDDGWGNLNFIADWTDVNNPTMEVDGPQVTGGNAGTLNSAYNGMNVVVRKHTNPGTFTTSFNVCLPRINLVYQLGVYNPATGTILGYFTNVARTVMDK